MKKIQNTETSENKQLEEGEYSQLFVNSITKMLTQKWHIKVKLFIKPDFCKEFLAFVESGADINCVHEGLIPTVYFEKTYQGAMSANSTPVTIDFKISNVHICIKMFVTRLFFYLSRDMNTKIVLRTPFLAILCPFKVDDEGIKSVYKRQNICFKFINSLKIKE